MQQGKPNETRQSKQQLIIPWPLLIRAFCFSLSLTGPLNLTKMYTTTGQKRDTPQAGLLNVLCDLDL